MFVNEVDEAVIVAGASLRRPRLLHLTAIQLVASTSIMPSFPSVVEESGGVRHLRVHVHEDVGQCLPVRRRCCQFLLSRSRGLISRAGSGTTGDLYRVNRDRARLLYEQRGGDGGGRVEDPAS